MPMLRAVLMTRHAISPRLAIRIFLNMCGLLHAFFARFAAIHAAGRFPMYALRPCVASFIAASHPEDAEFRRQDRRVQRRRERQAEYAARLRGIDHAVVPQSRGRVVGVTLRLVLRADGRLERLLFLRAPLSALRLDAF